MRGEPGPPAVRGRRLGQNARGWSSAAPGGLRARQQPQGCPGCSPLLRPGRGRATPPTPSAFWAALAIDALPSERCRGRVPLAGGQELRCLTFQGRFLLDSISETLPGCRELAEGIQPCYCGRLDLPTLPQPALEPCPGEPRAAADPCPDTRPEPGGAVGEPPRCWMRFCPREPSGWSLQPALPGAFHKVSIFVLFPSLLFSGFAPLLSPPLRE